MSPIVRKDYFDKVAASCGADPGVVEAILRKSYEKRCLYHGVSVCSAVDEVFVNGLYPREVNGGGEEETVWSFGRHLFSRDGVSPDATDYSTFFHHAHNRQGMTLVVSNPFEFEMDDMTWDEMYPPGARPGEGDGIFVVRGRLGKDYYAVLHVELPVKGRIDDSALARKMGMAREKKMMDMLYMLLQRSQIAGRQKSEPIDFTD